MKLLQHQQWNNRYPGRAAGILSVLFGALALLCAAPAMASPVTFQSFAPATYESPTTLIADNVNLQLLDSPFGASQGMIVDADNPFSCDLLACPSGGQGNYLAIFNDGGVNISLGGDLHFRLTGLDFAFIAPLPGQPDFNYGQLQLAGMLADGSVLMTSLDFPGQDANGNFMFSSALLDASFRSSIFTGLTINACIFNADLACVNSLENPAFFQAQFALDNLDLAAVPEPASFLLVGLGLGALALTRRRSAKPAATAFNPVQGA
jgi:hypothetical protein